MTWSILILTLPGRKHYLTRLLYFLKDYVTKDIEILIDDRIELTVGEKRTDLIKKSNGKYFSFIDDDDMVTDDYVGRILEAITKNPDVITMQGWMTTNGINRVDWVIKLNERYEERIDNGVAKYFRYPNHLCVFKKELVGHLRFMSINAGEDYEWATRIKEMGLLKNEIHIEEKIYHYDFKTKK